ncbi:MAG: hypothetical protein PHF29_02435 [Candidatus Riflebacteria bacterium]|nr:hypothetical protein [Candidatus Riflebacteria bacterium]
MGFFAPLAATYVVSAIVFMVLAVGFVALDTKCKSARPKWLTFTAITGPIGLVSYVILGRKN